MLLRILDHRPQTLFYPSTLQTRLVHVGEKFPISGLCKPLWIGMVSRVFNACGTRSESGFTASKEAMSPTPGLWRVQSPRLSPKQA